MNLRLRPSALLLAAVIAGGAAAQSRVAPPPDPADDALMSAAGFLSAHPDMDYRIKGMNAYRAKSFDDARRFFSRAAYYADKPSQGMLGEMHWNGDGVPRDPVLAYIWMDLAAERGYRGFLRLREHYWDRLDEAQRARVAVEGPALYARYGDDAARPRYAVRLRATQRQFVGSRLGSSTQSVQVSVPTLAGYETIDGSKMFDERYWDPDKYFAWQDQIWMKPLVGRVDVGAIETLDADARIPKTAPQVDAPEPDVPEPDGDAPGARAPAAAGGGRPAG
ncbi:SEL1-like repeat protein [Cognatilysobacter tabacisoli]|uniref:SEL1-like repeat protein n=1 Tax=Cognatilysobacter tabacisoli TaxID=2315424 RepID=UPI000E6AFD08|nr:SEL1-like repeat protein [Lysobacter tabacisoli]